MLIMSLIVLLSLLYEKATSKSFSIKFYFGNNDESSKISVNPKMFYISNPILTFMVNANRYYDKPITENVNS